MKKYKRSAYSIAVCTALALTMQASHAAPGNDRAVENAARRAFNAENHIRRENARMFQVRDNATRRHEARILRLDNRTQIDTATTLNAIQVTRAAQRLTSLGLGRLPTDLNLRSRRESYVLPSLSGNVTISRDGQSYVVNNSTRLTAAELAAVHQILSEGGQSLSIGRKGNAEGGSMTLDTAAVQGLTGINIPKNVTVLGDFSSAQDLSVAGDIRNSGNLIVRSGDPSVQSAVISANNIRNARTGNIGTLDAGANTLDLNLFADLDIVNHGNISGGRNVSLVAGGSITNVIEPGSSASDGLPTITARQNLSLQSRTIVNQGIVAATAGNINIADQLSSPAPLISVNSQGGTFSAANGDITLGNNSFIESDAMILNGGDYHSNKLLINVGEASVDGIVGDVTGVVKISAGVAHIGASTADLKLGQSVITGDPTFFNDAGDVTINGDLIFDEAIAILASGDITDGGLAFNIRARNGSDAGQPITIIAGTTLKAVNGAVPDSLAQDGRQITQGFVQISTASKIGGSVLLNSSTIDASGINGQPGGNVLIVAQANRDNDGGVVNVANVTATGAGGGANGNIKVIASSNSATAINAGTFVTGNGTGARGNISLTNAQVKLKMTADTTGNVVGTLKLGKLAAGGISTSSVSALGGNLDILTGGSAAIGGTGLSADSSSPNINGGAISVTAGDITVASQVSSFGADGVDGILPGESGGNGSAGGAITLTATKGNLTIAPTALVASQGGDGGSGVNGANGTGLGATGNAGGAGGTGGTGGDISFNALGDITIQNGAIVNAWGGTGGDAGSGGDGSGGPGAGGIGGIGGTAGSGGNSGNLKFTSEESIIGLETPITLAGGDAGAAGGGGGGGSGATGIGGTGGAGGNGASGGNSGTIELRTSESGDINVAQSLITQGGASSGGGDGGNGGTSSTNTGGSGGAGGDGVAGANAGNVTLAAVDGVIHILGVEVSSFGATGANGGNGGSGANSTSGSAGNGGSGGDAGSGGNSGLITLTASKKAGVITSEVTASINSQAGVAGNGGAGGDGGATTGGGGNGGNGGNGGTTQGDGFSNGINISGSFIDVTQLFTRSALISPFAGSGGSGGESFAGAGGNGGNGGSVSSALNTAGNITITGGTVAVGFVNAGGGIAASAGDGGAGGAGGVTSDTGNGGNGGDGGSANRGGDGGTLSILGRSIDLTQISVGANQGGDGGDGGVAGDSGASAGLGGNGGDGGNSGNAGNGGSMLLTSNGKGSPGVVVNVVLAADGGGSSTAGDGGDGGFGVDGGGNGGNGGTDGFTGNGGLIEIVAGSNVVVANVSAEGGGGFQGGLGGSGGGAENSANGGNAGSGGNGANGGNGGELRITTKKGSIAVSGTLELTGNNGSNGGNGGGGGFTDAGQAGANGDGGNGGIGGNGGTFTFLNKSGSLTVDDLLAEGGDGGVGGAGGNGFFAGSSTDGSGGVGGAGGIGGNAGTAGGALITSASIDINNVNFLGGVGGDGGQAGNGSDSVNATGGAGGNGGAAGTGGRGGSLVAIKIKGNIDIGVLSTNGNSGGAGGQGGNGGISGAAIGAAGGNAGNGSIGGAGGLVQLNTKGVITITSLDARGGDGGDGGQPGDGDSGTVTAGPGGNGGNGGNGATGGTVELSNDPGTIPDVAGGTGGNLTTGGFGVPGGNDGVDGSDGVDGEVIID